MALLSEATMAYKSFLIDQPILSQALTMSVFSGLGDLLAQTNVMRTPTETPCTYDWKRMAKFSAKGLGCGVIWSHWFMLAEKWSDLVTTFILQHSNDDIKMFAIIRTIVNLFLEQFIACPIIYGLWDLPIIAFMDGVSLAKIPRTVGQKLFQLITAHAKLWTFVNIVIYNIPLNLRVLVVSIADLFWESIVSTVASKTLDEADQDVDMKSKVKIS